MDNLSEERAQLLHPKIRDEILSILRDCDNANILMRITQGYRTIEEQDKLYAISRTIKGQEVTKAKGGKSWHNYGLAFDFCLMKPNGIAFWNINHPDWNKVVLIAKSHGFQWGGDWASPDVPDYPHFQKKFGMTIDEAYKKLVDGNVDKQGYITIRT